MNSVGQEPFLSVENKTITTITMAVFVSVSYVVCHLVVNVGATNLVPSHVVKSLQFIWRSGHRRFHLREPNLQVSCSDFP